MRSLLCLSITHKSLPPVPLGLDVIQQELEVLGCQFTNIVNLNKQVYGPIYANIFRKLLLRDEAVGKTDISLPTNWREAGAGEEMEVSPWRTVLSSFLPTAHIQCCPQSSVGLNLCSLVTSASRKGHIAIDSFVYRFQVKADRFNEEKYFVMTYTTYIILVFSYTFILSISMWLVHST